MTRPPALRVHLAPDAIVADNFAGGGGASTGLSWAIGRAPDIAINHSPKAIAVHRANHPTTEHHLSDVWEVDPVAACRGRRVALAWFSPDCTHFSKAKGGTPRKQKVRALAWVASRWARAVAPDVIVIENVEEFLDWGPLHRTHSAGCRGTKGTPCPKACHHGKPDPARKGQTFRRFWRRMEKHGYRGEHRLLVACDYGAPTKRRRLFVQFRRDGRPITWPEPTHGPSRSRPYRTAAECIDWTIPCPSIFERNRPLAEATMRRIARGVQKFIIEAGQPFVVPYYGERRDGETRAKGVNEPLPTQTTANRFALTVPYLVHRSNGERQGQAPRIYDPQLPLGTIVAQGQKHALCTAFLARHYSDRPTGGWAGGTPLDRPIPTITTRDHHALVAAFLVRYNGTGDAEPLDRPLGTLTTKDRYGIVLVTIDGEQYELVDIGMRMLTSRELYRAQGFPDDYTIDPLHNGKPLTKTDQVKLCGNSVCPQMSEAIALAALRQDPPLAVAA